MKNLIRICLIVILVLLLSFTLQAQGLYAELEKNRNIQAKNLIHKLNKSKDTLILQSDKKINYLYSINKNLGRDFDVYVDTTYYELPLNKLPKGKHVLVAVQSPKRIVFVVKILKDNPDSEPVKVVSEESIIREPVQVTSTEKG
ncbi:MAG: hypothetical protein HRU49_07880 [Winogradskyella sp.]|uniref:hypothetical protein n=1 Tax=Winogradskyella sp. TaxID=1883156 RepID=UPI0025D71A2F|nr:hypothetical protein [Winogradskyella sp.]NRB83677.1 hypothetical protein [Winogradskyella sp.]